MIKLDIGLDPEFAPEFAKFLIKRTDFDPQLFQLTPVLEPYRSQKPLNRQVKRFIIP